MCSSIQRFAWYRLRSTPHRRWGGYLTVALLSEARIPAHITTKTCFSEPLTYVRPESAGSIVMAVQQPVLVDQIASAEQLPTVGRTKPYAEDRTGRRDTVALFTKQCGLRRCGVTWRPGRQTSPVLGLHREKRTNPRHHATVTWCFLVRDKKDRTGLSWSVSRPPPRRDVRVLGEGCLYSSSSST
jgi:hypothetical protein